MTDVVQDPWRAWRDEWRPVQRPGARGRNRDLDDYLLEILDPACRVLIEGRAGAKAEHLWTMLDGDGLSVVICAGNHLVDRMAYILTEKPHGGCPATPHLVLGAPKSELHVGECSKRPAPHGSGSMDP